jgi:hypothetical protein
MPRISFEDLQNGDGTQEIYSWQDPDSNQIRVWLMAEIRAAIDSSQLNPRKIIIPLSDKHWLWLQENRGIEKHRLDSLRKNAEAIMNPGIMMHMKDDTYLTLDGHHRMYLLSELEINEMRILLFEEDELLEFEIIGVPEIPKEKFNTAVRDGYSGL